MRAINIIGIVASVVLFILAAYYSAEVSSARWRSYDYLWDDNSYNYYGPSPSELTRQGGLIVMLLTLYFLFTNIMNLTKVKTMTSKVMSIIGLSLNGIVFFVNLAMIALAEDMHFEESMGPVGIIFSFIMLAFTIVYLVQSVKVLKPQKTTQNQQTIDDIPDEDEII